MEQIIWASASLLIFPSVWIGAWVSRKVSQKLGTVLTNLGIALWGLCWLWIPLTTQPRIGDVLGTALAVVGALLALVGGVLAGIASLRILPVIGWDQIDPTELVTTGVYGFVRHPLYAGLVLMYIGWSLVKGAVYALFLSPFFYLSLRFEAWLEEWVWLRPKFGEAFKAYQAKVPAFFPLWLWAILTALLVVIVLSIITGLILF